MSVSPGGDASEIQGGAAPEATSGADVINRSIPDDDALAI